MMHVYEHMPDVDTAREVLVAIHSALNRDGVLLIEVPDIRYQHGWFWMLDVTHRYPLTIFSLRRELAKAGYDVVESGLSSSGLSHFWYVPCLFIAQLARIGCLLLGGAVPGILQKMAGKGPCAWAIAKKKSNEKGQMT